MWFKWIPKISRPISSWIIDQFWLQRCLKKRIEQVYILKEFVEKLSLFRDQWAVENQANSVLWYWRNLYLIEYRMKIGLDILSLEQPTWKISIRKWQSCCLHYFKRILLTPLTLWYDFALSGGRWRRARARKRARSKLSAKSAF